MLLTLALGTGCLGLRGDPSPAGPGGDGSTTGQVIGEEIAESEPTASQESPLLQSSRAVEVDLRALRQLLPRDAMASIYEPRFVSAVDAKLDPTELIIGVEINGDSKAYPIGPLTRREMVNDEVGGVPILVTW